MRRPRHLAVRWFALSVLIWPCLACGHGDSSDSAERSTASAIFGGSDSPPSQDFTVRINIKGGVTGFGYSSGVLVTPTLVFTSGHTVAGVQFASNLDTCRLNTTPAPADDFEVVVGSAAVGGTSYAVKRVFFDSSHTECIHDIAALELTQPVTGISFLPIVLDTVPAVGSSVTDIGWGSVYDDGGLSSTRQQGSGTLLLNAAGDLTLPTGGTLSVPNGYLVASNSACPGDSGGPLVDAQGNLLGLLSANSHSKLSANDCSDVLSIWTPFFGNVGFTEQVFQAVGLMPHRAGQAAPSDLGGTCALDNQCNSNYCVQLGGTGTCSKACQAATDCPAPLACTDTGRSFSVCLAPQAQAQQPSCSTGASGPHDAGASGGLIMSLLCLGLGVLRRARLNANAA